MYSCAQCAIHACYQQDHSKMPANCPMRQADQMQKAFAVYSQPAYQDFYIQSCIVEAEGYGEWPRLRETIEFAKKLGYTRLGGNVLSQLALGIRYAEGQGRITRGTNGTYVLSADGTARADATMKTFLSNP